MKGRRTGSGRVAPVNGDGHVIGLDIGATAVRAAILAPDTVEGQPSVTVHGLGSVPLPIGVVVSGVVYNQSILTEAVKSLWQENGFNCNHVILGIASQQVLVRDIQVPNLTPQQRAKALPFQAREIVALPMDQVLLDFAQLSAPDPETNLVNGLLIATPRQPVVLAVEAVERAGLKVARVDLSSFAALRSIADKRLSVEAVVDMGAHLTTIVIHDRGVPKLVRTLQRGGLELSETLADKASLNFEDAERAKMEFGLTGQNPAVSATLTDAIRPLLAEIRSSVNYFRSGNEDSTLERISLTGGASLLLGLADVVAKQVGIPTNLVAPMQHIRNRWAPKQAPSIDAEISASAVSVGLAMGAAA